MVTRCLLYNNMMNIGVIVAGGTGERFGGHKQTTILNNKPVYQWVAGIDLKLNVTEIEFDKIYSKLNKNE